MGKFAANLASRTDMKLSMVIGVGVGVAATLVYQKYQAKRPVRATIVTE